MAFEFNGEKYKVASKHQKEWGSQLISELTLNGNEKILDLGCGDGTLTKQLSLLVPEGSVLGIDASLGMIDAAKNYVGNNLSFVQMDINTMAFNATFDIIFSNAALHWVKDHHRLLKNTFRALKLQGAIFWDFAGEGNCANFFEVIKETMAEVKYREFFCDFKWPWFTPSKSYYQKQVEAIGFSKVMVREENRDRYFSNEDAMIKWLDQPSLVPFMQCIPNEMKAVFRGDVIEKMLQKTMQSDGTYFETFRRIHVYALK